MTPLLILAALAIITAVTWALRHVDPTATARALTDVEQPRAEAYLDWPIHVIRRRRVRAGGQYIPHTDPQLRRLDQQLREMRNA